MKTHLILTVHGTWSNRSDNQSVWWEKNSEFCKSITNAILDQHIDPDFHEFEWSGDNSELEREQAAKLLSKVLKLKTAQYNTVSILAHSHGGNVTADALAELSKLPEQFEKIGTVVSFGTPFFNKKRPIESRAADAIIRLALIPIFLGVSLLIFAAMQMFDGSKTLGSAFGLYGGLVVAIASLLVGLIFWWTKRTFLFGAPSPNECRERQKFRWWSISHENDEVITALLAGSKHIVSFAKTQTIRRAMLGLFKKAILAAIVVLFITIASIMGTILIYAGDGWAKLPFIWETSQAVLLWISATGLIALCVAYCFSSQIAAAFNHSLSKVLLSMAHGQDSEMRLTSVSRLPVYFESKAIVLTKIEEQKMVDFVTSGRKQWLEENSSVLAELKLSTHNVDPLSLPISVDVTSILLHNAYFSFPFIKKTVVEAIVGAHHEC